MFADSDVVVVERRRSVEEVIVAAAAAARRRRSHRIQTTPHVTTETATATRSEDNVQNCWGKMSLFDKTLSNIFFHNALVLQPRPAVGNRQSLPSSSAVFFSSYIFSFLLLKLARKTYAISWQNRGRRDRRRNS